MAHLLPLLTEMRGRLGIYLGTTSLTKLAAFLRGYDYAVEKLGVAEADPLLPGFRDWVHRRFQTSTLSWEETILRNSHDETDAVRHFWQLLDEYLAETKGAVAPAAQSADLVRAAEKVFAKDEELYRRLA